MGSQTLAQSEPVSEGFGKLGLVQESISLLTLISSLLKSKPQTGEGAAGTPSLPTSTCLPSIQAELDAEAESVRIHKGRTKARGYARIPSCPRDLYGA